jgi:hypothetical protein
LIKGRRGFATPGLTIRRLSFYALLAASLDEGPLARHADLNPALLGKNGSAMFLRVA